MIRALIFDFDGLVLETEGPSYQSWVEVYRSFGQSLPFSIWSKIIGTTQATFDPRLDLQTRVNEPVDWDRVEAERQKNESALIEAQVMLPGVEAYLNTARRLGLKIGLASSSSCQWVTGHLTRLRLEDYFDCIRASDDVKHVKPDPALYLTVLQALEVRADEAIAFEDSPIGIHSAKQAGLYCIAIPNPLTSQLNLDEADFRMGSLADIPLEQLLTLIHLD
jgi:HAD superfamily hydrolase (TIGR01509 family)